MATRRGQALGLQNPCRHGHIVEDAITFTVVRVGMVRTAGQVSSQALFQGRPAGANCAANRSSRADDQLRRPGETDPPELFLAQPAMDHFFQVFGIVHETELVIVGWLGGQQLDPWQACVDDPLMQKGIFRHRKAVPFRQGHQQMIGVEYFHWKAERLGALCGLRNMMIDARIK